MKNNQAIPGSPLLVATNRFFVGFSSEFLGVVG